MATNMKAEWMCECGKHTHTGTDYFERLSHEVEVA
jgi:hypothetical protein